MVVVVPMVLVLVMVVPVVVEVVDTVVVVALSIVVENHNKKVSLYSFLLITPKIKNFHWSYKNW